MIVEFCLPVKDEAEILDANVRRLLDWLRRRDLPFTWRLVIAVNGSGDQTAYIASTLAESFPRDVSFFVLQEAGKGLALRTAFSRSQADILAFMDIDFAVDISATASLIMPIINSQADIVVGSRLLSASRVDRPFFRSLTSRVYNLFASLIVGSPVQDLQCGFKAIRRDAFERIAPLLTDSQWFFDTELIVWARNANMRIHEIPVIWREHEYALRQSKVKVVHDSRLFLLALLRLRSRLKIAK